MTSIESRTSQLSLFGRLADDLTRKVIRSPDFTVSMEGDRRHAISKHDGYFAFADLRPSAGEYRIRIDARAYQRRTLVQLLPTAEPVELTRAGEDELYLSIAGVTASQNRVTFERIAFVPPIEAGAAVVGQNGFTATLDESLGGQDITFAVLTTVTGLAAGQLLRIVRSHNLLMRPGPSYSFPADTTILAVKVAEADPPRSPVGGAVVEINRINGSLPTVANVGGLELTAFSLGGDPSAIVVLDGDEKRAVTNVQGDAVFYLSGSRPVKSVDVVVSKYRYRDATCVIDISIKSRNFQVIQLTSQLTA